jgi:uncharacterized protein YaaN involved in tellurite resistance
MENNNTQLTHPSIDINASDASLDSQIVVTSTKNIGAMTTAEKDHYRALAKDVVIGDSGTLTNYGSQSATVLGQTSQALIDNVRSNCGNEITEMLLNVQAELNQIDLGDFTESRWKSFLINTLGIKRLRRALTTKLDEYDTVKNNVKKMADKISALATQTKADNNTISLIVKNDYSYFLQLGELIKALQVKLEDTEEHLRELKANPNESNFLEIQNTENFRNQLVTKINDMCGIQNVMKINILELASVRNTNEVIATKADTFISTTLNIWTAEIATAIQVQKAKNGIDILNALDKANQDMLVRTAQMVHTTVNETAKLSVRTTFDPEKINQAANELTAAIQDSQRILSDEQSKAANYQSQMAKISKNIDNALLSVKSGDQKNYLTGETVTFKELEHMK